MKVRCVFSVRRIDTLTIYFSSKNKHELCATLNIRLRYAQIHHQCQATGVLIIDAVSILKDKILMPAEFNSIKTSLNYKQMQVHLAI